MIHQLSEQSRRLGSEPPAIVSLECRKPKLRFWLLFVGGSLLLHLLLLRWVGAALRPNPKLAAVPIDLISLPLRSDREKLATSPGKASSTLPATQPRAIRVAAPLAAQYSAEGALEGQTLLLPLSRPDQAVAKPSVPVQTASRRFAKVTPAVTAPAAATPAQALSQDLLQPPGPQPPITQPVQRRRQPDRPPETQQPLHLPPPLPSADLAQQPVPSSPSPTAIPLIASQPILLPVPNLSQPQSGLQTTSTAQTQVPSHLTANLTTSTLPPLGRPEQPIQPQVSVRRFMTNSQLPPCAVTPEVLYFLGKTVAMRVATDTAGQVVQMVTEESSQNLAYDDLATCLVRNWDFKPAVAKNQAPVSPAESSPEATSPGILVWITIDRS